MAKYEKSVLPYSATFLHGDQKTQMLLQCLFSVYSLLVYSPSHGNYSQKKSSFTKLHDKYCQN